MNFLNPFFLLGLIAVAIPVIIHLVNLRKAKKISFSTLAFFNELQKSTIRRIRIKQYLLMAIRALAILLLALALARPFLPPTLSSSSGSEEPKVIALLIDNSASMSLVGSSGPLIDQAKNIAATIINGSRSDDRFIVATTNGEFETTSFTGANSALERLEEIESVNKGNYTADVFSQIYQQLQQSPLQQGIIYVVTDAQESQFEGMENLSFESDEEQKPVALQMVQLGETEQQNLAIADISLKSQMLSRGSPIQLGVEVRNVGEVPADNQFVSLEVQGRMAGQYKISLDPGESQEFLFELNASSAGDITGQAILEGDEVAFDNTRYFALHIPESRSVLLINSADNTQSDFVSYLKPALEAARQTTTQIEFIESTVDEVDQSEWQQYDAIIFDDIQRIPDYWFSDLQRFVQNGGGLFFFPSEQGNVSNYNAFLDLFNAGSFENIRGEYASFDAIEEVAPLVEGHPILDDLFDKEDEEQLNVDMPELFFYYLYDPPGNTGSYAILESETGAPVLNEQRFGDGNVLISSIGTDPGWSNFPVNPLFAPMYYRSILYAASSERGGIAEHILGTPFEWQTDIGRQNVELVWDSQSARPDLATQVDGVRITYPGREWEPGILQITAPDKEISIAVNQNIMESEVTTLTSQDLENVLSNYVTVNSIIDAENASDRRLQEQLSAASFGKEIWNWLIWLALILLISETVISRFYKAETIS